MKAHTYFNVLSLALILKPQDLRVFMGFTNIYSVMHVPRWSQTHHLEFFRMVESQFIKFKFHNKARHQS